MTTEDKKGPEAAATAGAGDQNLRKGSIMGNSTNREHDARLSDEPLSVTTEVDEGFDGESRTSRLGPLHGLVQLAERTYGTDEPFREAWLPRWADSLTRDEAEQLVDDLQAVLDEFDRPLVEVDGEVQR